MDIFVTAYNNYDKTGRIDPVKFVSTFSINEKLEDPSIKTKSNIRRKSMTGTNTETSYFLLNKEFYNLTPEKRS